MLIFVCHSFLLSYRIVSFVFRISKELTPQRQLKEDAVLVVDQLMVLVQYTAVSEYSLKLETLKAY